MWLVPKPETSGEKCSILIEQVYSCLYSFCFWMADCTSVSLASVAYKLHLKRSCMNMYQKAPSHTDYSSQGKWKKIIYKSLNQISASSTNTATSERKTYFNLEFYIKYRQVLQNAPTIREHGMGRFLYIGCDFRHLIDMALGIPLSHTRNIPFKITHSFYALTIPGKQTFMENKNRSLEVRNVCFPTVLLMRAQWS